MFWPDGFSSRKGARFIHTNISFSFSCRFKEPKGSGPLVDFLRIHFIQRKEKTARHHAASPLHPSEKHDTKLPRWPDFQISIEAHFSQTIYIHFRVPVRFLGVTPWYYVWYQKQVAFVWSPFRNLPTRQEKHVHMIKKSTPPKNKQMSPENWWVVGSDNSFPFKMVLLCRGRIRSFSQSVTNPVFFFPMAFCHLGSPGNFYLKIAPIEIRKIIWSKHLRCFGFNMFIFLRIASKFLVLINIDSWVLIL